MRKIFQSALCAVIALCFCLTGCTGQTTDTEFDLKRDKPWGTNYEKCTYRYLKTTNEGETVAQGVYTVEISTKDGETTISTALNVYSTDGSSDVMTSTVTMEANSLYPRLSQKKYVARDNDGNVKEGFGYDISINYTEGKATGSFDNTTLGEREITFAQVDVRTYDNEQLYWIVRAARNATAENNSGNFAILSGVDSLVAGSGKIYQMMYTVMTDSSVVCAEMGGKQGVGSDGRIACHTVALKINDDRSGSTTTLHFAIGDETEPGKNRVLIHFSRPQYDMEKFTVAFNHSYTLTDYIRSL